MRTGSSGTNKDGAVSRSKHKKTRYVDMQLKYFESSAII